MTLINLHKEISPNKSMGGLVLGQNISILEEILKKELYKDNLKFYQDSIFSTRYSINSMPLEINVDTRNGKIYKLTALEGYSGAFNKIIKIGTPVKDFLNDKGLDFYYDEVEQALFSKKEPGISLELDEEDPLPEEIHNLKIKYISVFLKDPKIYI